VEVEDFARVVGFEEADLDGLALVRRVDDRDQGRVTAVDGVIRIDEHRTQTIGVQVYGVRHIGDACHASDTGEDCSSHAGSFHFNTPRSTTGLCFMRGYRPTSGTHPP